MASSNQEQQQACEYRLIKRPAKEVGQTVVVNNNNNKRLKTTGVEFRLRQLTLKDKIQTNDEVHKSIELCPVTRALVDTQVFQRLRNIAQLGTSQYLYSCANGNRFQHSLGVAHLAEQMCKTMKEEQPNLGTTDKDVLCVKLAGLLHDVGHGPYSHVYEGFYEDVLPMFLEAHPDLKQHYKDCDDGNDRLPQVPDDWCHELSSLMMIDTALASIGLRIDLQNLDAPLQQIGHGVDAKSMRVFKPPNVEDGVLTSRDFVFIKECVYGKPLPEVEHQLGIYSFIGRREPEQEWLYDIVNNRHSGLDVDKIDYFARDSGRTVGSSVVDTKLIEDARVAKVLCKDAGSCPRCNGTPKFHLMICYPKKRVEAAMDFFKRRLFLHTIIYQHKKTVAVESMLCDILCLADPILRLHSSQGERFPISRAVLKSDFLLRLDDNVFSLIEHSTQPELAEARDLCRRFKRHDFYKCAVNQPLDIEGDHLVDNHDDTDDDDDDGDNAAQTAKNSRRDKMIWAMEEHEIQNGILLEKQYWEPTSEGDTSERFPLEAKDFVVRKYHMHHGKKDKNPLNFMRFFEEMNDNLLGHVDNLPVAKQIRESQYRSIIPSSMQKTGVRIFCRESSKRELVAQFFFQWFERMGRGQVGEAEITPFPSGGGFGLEEDSDNEGVMHNRGEGQQQARFLSQESEDEHDDDYHGDARGLSQMDQSPVPLRRR